MSNGPPGPPVAVSAADAAESGGSGHGFGTAPVFLASISTILGAILFLRFGYAVGHVGLGGALLIVVLGHLVTLPTALAISEIATNRRVEGGGEYFIISRSFGQTIGATIGLTLYLSQAISVAFYMIAFAEAFRPLEEYFWRWGGLAFDPRFVSVPASFLLVALVLAKGADLGVRALWVIAAVLGLSLAMFFAGAPVAGMAAEPISLFHGIPGSDPFMIVFAIVFPAFTGMTAGVGLSGDLANPRRSIPRGVLGASLIGFVVYVAVVVKLAVSAPSSLLATDPLVMSRIAIWGPIVPIGLACATLSSAVGSILVAPRTLQALGADGVTPWGGLNRFLTLGVGPAKEPRNATLLTSGLALITVALGSIDFVARIVSMFFMVTYGSLCAISVLEHFAARPSYRPSFRSKWYLSLLGAVLCLLLMFQMDPAYAVLAMLVMAAIYLGLRRNRGGPSDLGELFRGVMAQTNRYFQIRLQRSSAAGSRADWRPCMVMVNERTFERTAPIQMLSWLCQHQGLGTYLHLVRGRLDGSTYNDSQRLRPALLDLIQARRSAIVVDTLVSPSLRTALAQAFQIPGMTGERNNLTLFELTPNDADAALAEIADGCGLAWQARISSLVLRHGGRFFGARRSIHIWLTWHDYDNASLMILLAYVLLGHPDWRLAEVQIYAAFPRAEVAAQSERLSQLISTGRLPMSPKNLRIEPTDAGVDFESLVAGRSAVADLVILGLTPARLAEKGATAFRRHPELGDVLFVSAAEVIAID